MAVKTGNKKAGTVWRGPEYKKGVERVMFKRLDRVTQGVGNDIVKSFPGSGIANATAAQRRASASAPGEIPHIQFGFLHNNIAFDRPKKLKRRLGTGIGGAQSVPYAASLEKGNNRGLAARPFMRPGLKRNKLNIRKGLGARIRKPILRGLR